MQADRFTIKTQEALQAALALAPEQRHAQVTPQHLLAALLDQEGGLVVPVLGKIGVAPDALRADVANGLAQLPTLSSAAEPTSAPELLTVLRAAEHEMRDLKDEYVSVEHVLLALAEDDGLAGRSLQAHGATHERVLQALAEVRGSHRVTDQTPEDKIQALEKYGRDLTAAARDGELDPGHRPRRRDPPRHPGPQPPHEEQPGPDRRARRRQDRDRRGPRPAHRQRRRPRVAARPPRHLARHRLAARRLEVPRRVRGAPEGRPQGGLRGARPGRAVPRRAAHDRRRRRRRGRRRRRQPAQADARPRRAARRRRDDARRVPQAHREGRRARAPLPARPRRRALRRGHDRDPARPEGALRGPPRRPHPGRRDRSPPRRSATATSPTASCPTRRSTSSTSRPRACASRSTRCPRRSTSSSAARCSSRSSCTSLAKENDDASRGPPRRARARARRAARAQLRA